MPKVSFYLRNEDLDKWKAIDKKTQWMHDSLNTITTHKIKDIELQDYSRTEQSKIDKDISERLMGGEDRLTRIETVTLCKKHQLPVLSGRTICGMKDCK